MVNVSGALLRDAAAQAAASAGLTLNYIIDSSGFGFRSPDQAIAATISAAPASMRASGCWPNKAQANAMA